MIIAMLLLPLLLETELILMLHLMLIMARLLLVVGMLTMIADEADREVHLLELMAVAAMAMPEEGRLWASLDVAKQ
jgi:hypothetical protein